MNTYSKYIPNVFLAKCAQQHKKGDIINVATKYGKENESIVFNLVYTKDGFYYYSIVRADGFNIQERAKAKADRYANWSSSASKKSDAFFEASQEGKDFLVLAEPIKIGHHSEKKHRALIERNHSRMRNCIAQQEKAGNHHSKSEYWSKRANDINLSMPESLEYYEFKLEEARERHEGLKNGTIERSHSFSLSYAKKDVNELTKKVELAKRLWL